MIKANNYRKTKLNIFLVIILLSSVGVAGFSYWNIESTYKTNAEYIKKTKQTIQDNEKKIQNDEMYKRLNNYGKKLNNLGALIAYKDSSVEMYTLLPLIKEKLPLYIVVQPVDYTRDKNIFSIDIIAPSPELLLETTKGLYKSTNKILENISYDNITKTSITFPGEKIPRVGYKVTLKSNILQDYLMQKSEERKQIKEIKKTKNQISSNLNEETTDIIINKTGSGNVQNEELQSTGTVNSGSLIGE